MFARKDEQLMEARIGNPNDNALEEMKISALNVSTDENRNIDPVTTAGLLSKSRAVAVEQLRDSKLHIDDISWQILLDLIVAMDIKKPVTVLDLATTLNVTNAIMLRYVRYLIDAGLIDKNTDGEGQERVPLKLTAAGNALTCDILQKIGQELVNF